MKKKFKDFLYIMPTYIVMVLMIILPVFFSLIYTKKNDSKEFEMLTLILVILAFIFIIIGIILSLLSIIDVYKKKKMDSGEKLIWYVLLFCLNICILPYYYYKNIKKSKKYRKFGIIYLISMIVICILSTYTSIYSTTMYNNYINEQKKIEEKKANITTYINSNDDSFEMAFKKGYKKETISEYDLYVKDEKRKIINGAFIYDTSKFEEKTLDDILNKQVEYIKGSKIDVKEKGERQSRIFNNKTITTIELEGKAEGTSDCVYKLSTISFEGRENIILYVIQVVSKDEYKKYNNELIEIINSVNLK